MELASAANDPAGTNLIEIAIRRSPETQATSGWDRATAADYFRAVAETHTPSARGRRPRTHYAWVRRFPHWSERHGRRNQSDSCATRRRFADLPGASARLRTW